MSLGPVLAAVPQPSISPAVVAAVLGAALLHAIWNALAHAVPDRLVGFALLSLAEMACAAGLLAVGDPLPAGAWGYVLASAAVHVLYLLLLLTSYQLGEFSQVYPLARGVGPLVVAVVATLVLGRPLPPLELAGVLAISGGLLGLVLAGGRPGRSDLPALGAAALTGLAIAGYTVIDGLAVAHAPVASYAGWLFLLEGVPLPLLAAARRGRALPGLLRRQALPGLVGGVVSMAAYGIVLWAQTSGALAPVAALRETSIVFGALIGAVFLGERFGTRRSVTALVVLAGVLLISLA